jgi:hypothetical protein
LSRRSPRAFSKSFLLAAVCGAALLGAGLVVGGCSAGTGATCQVREDCSAGLVCCNDGLPRGTCQAVCPERADAAIDAALADDAFSVEADDAFTPAPDAASEPDAASTPDAAGLDGGS